MHIPYPSSDGIRRYGANSYRKGRLEDTFKCICSVSDSRGWYSYQCNRRRGYGPEGLFCKYHAKHEDEILSYQIKGEG